MKKGENVDTSIIWLLIALVATVLGLALTYLKDEKVPTNHTDFESFYNALLEYGRYTRVEAEALYEVWQRSEMVKP